MHALACVCCRMPWQRLLSLQVLRSLMADHQLLYVLFTSYDMSIHHDMNAVHDTLSVAVEAIKVSLLGSFETSASLQKQGVHTIWTPTLVPLALVVVFGGGSKIVRRTCLLTARMAYWGRSRRPMDALLSVAQRLCKLAACPSAMKCTMQAGTFVWGSCFG